MPFYPRGNKLLILFCLWNLLLFVGTKFFYVSINRYVIQPSSQRV